MLLWIICPVMLRVIRSECIASLPLGSSLGDYYIEAVEWMSLMGLDLGASCGSSPRQGEYRVTHGREHTLKPSGLMDMWPWGSIPLAESRKMNILQNWGQSGRTKACDKSEEESLEL